MCAAGPDGALRLARCVLCVHAARGTNGRSKRQNVTWYTVTVTCLLGSEPFAYRLQPCTAHGNAGRSQFAVRSSQLAARTRVCHLPVNNVKLPKTSTFPSSSQPKEAHETHCLQVSLLGFRLFFLFFPNRVRRLFPLPQRPNSHTPDRTIFNDASILSVELRVCSPKKS